MLRRDWEKIKEASVGTGDSQSRAMETVRIVASEDKIPLKDKSIDVVLRFVGCQLDRLDLIFYVVT